MENSKVFEHLIETTENYIVSNGLDSMVLGVSGGIDSTVCAAICHEVAVRSNGHIKFIGRSLPIKNQVMYIDEFDTSQLVGNVFCDDFRVVNLSYIYETMLKEIVEYEEGKKVTGLSYRGIEDKSESQTAIANGNIQARLRMIYLYNLAGINKGLVIDTDNLTEHYLGFFTIHGDQGDFNPIGGLWKSEVYELANYIAEYYKKQYLTYEYDIVDTEIAKHYKDMSDAITASINLTPTDGLGISNSDLEQIGAKTYDDVDDILQTFVYFTTAANITNNMERLKNKYSEETVKKVLERYSNSNFKRKKLPITINTDMIELGTMESCKNN